MAGSGAAPERDHTPLTPDEIWEMVPAADEIGWDTPQPRIECPPAWETDSIAVDLANQECVRLMANCLFDPPITEQEIDRHARRHGLSRRQAELEIRRSRDDDDG